MNWSAPIDLYCERTDAAFWSEPVNAVSNAAFLLAAIAAFVRWRREGSADKPAAALIVVIVAIAIGSFWFHTVATSGAVLADVIPIAVFIYGYLLLALRRFLHLSAVVAVVIVVAYAGASQALTNMAPRLLNGSLTYMPALAALIAVAIATPQPRVRTALGLSAAVFAVSLAVRTADLAVCDVAPIGTHFLWHILNAVVLYLLMRVALGAGADRTRGALVSPRSP